MLTEAQKIFLEKLPLEKAERIVVIHSFDPAMKGIAHGITSEIQQRLPHANIFFIGAAALGIAGENDIDIAVVSNNTFDQDELVLTKLFGEPSGGHQKRYRQWEFERGGFSVELSLNNDMAPQIKEQLDIFELLQSKPKLKHEYEQIKLAMNGKSYRDYQQAKYEFFNRVLR